VGQLCMELSQLGGPITLVDQPMISTLSRLTGFIEVDESCIKLIDLGAFKHREDPKAPMRKLALTGIDSIFKKMEKVNVVFNNTSSAKVVELGIQAILRSLAIDMNNSGDELYPIVVSLIRTMAELNASLLVKNLPETLSAISKIVDTCPVGKRDGLTLNHSGVVLGQLVLAIVEVLQLVAYDEGISVKSLVGRDYPVFEETRKKIYKETTEGSILLAANATIGNSI